MRLAQFGAAEVRLVAQLYISKRVIESLRAAVEDSSGHAVWVDHHKVPTPSLARA